MWGQCAILFLGHQDARFHQKTVRISVSFTGEFSPKFWPEKYDFDLYKEFFAKKMAWFSQILGKKNFQIVRFLFLW